MAALAPRRAGSDPVVVYRALFELVLARMPAEGVHRLALSSLRMVSRIPGCATVLRRLLGARDPALRVQALGLSFPSPLGVAAGVDKDATWFESLGLLGFGYVEVGTVTAHPQAGNPGPRVFRIVRDRALLNRMGFPNQGAHAIATHLAHRRGSATAADVGGSSSGSGRQRHRHEGGRGRGNRDVIVGANVGKSMTVPISCAGVDYRASVRELAPVCDYLVVNVSSPNTPGLRSMQSADLLAPLLAEIRQELSDAAIAVPLLIKIAPDLSDAEVDAIADLALELSLDGIVAVNSSEDRSILSHTATVSGVEGGGVSGAPLRARALEVLERLHERVGDRLVLISVGGISTPEDAWERIAAGATLLQAYTGFVYGGPGWPAAVNRSLARRVRQAGAASIQEMVGRRSSASPDRDPRAFKVHESPAAEADLDRPSG
jgi:dihydroorotate dehydrogenase